MIRPNDIFSAFISLTAKVENGRQNVLDFGSDDMTFLRGEIHIIRSIFLQPGIYASEIARQFGITRAVVAKNIARLDKKGALRKERDPEDQKRFKLYLTPKGEKAALLHEEYHHRHDQRLYSYVENLSEADLAVLRDFLLYANELVDHHY